MNQAELDEARDFLATALAKEPPGPPIDIPAVLRRGRRARLVRTVANSLAAAAAAVMIIGSAIPFWDAMRSLPIGHVTQVQVGDPREADRLSGVLGTQPLLSGQEPLRVEPAAVIPYQALGYVKTARGKGYLHFLAAGPGSGPRITCQGNACRALGLPGGPVVFSLPLNFGGWTSLLVQVINSDGSTVAVQVDNRLPGGVAPPDRNAPLPFTAAELQRLVLTPGIAPHR